MRNAPIQIIAITSQDRTYWSPLEAIAAADASLEIHYASSLREIERLIAAAPNKTTIAITDLSLEVGQVARLRSTLPAGSRILAFITEAMSNLALGSLDEGLYDYILDEHPQRLHVVLAHVRHALEAEAQAEKAIAKAQLAEEHQRFLIENILDIITVTDINATILYESASLERVLGYKPEELIGRNAFSLIHPLDIPRTMPVFMLAVATPGVPHSTRFRFKHKNGTWRMLEVVGKTLRDPEHGFRLIVTSRDITDRERAEEALGQSELRFRSVIEGLSEGIVISTNEGEVSYVNSRMCELIGYTAGELVGKKLYELIFPPSLWPDRHSWIASKAARKPQKMEVEILRKDGSKCWVEIRTTPYQDGDQNLGTISAFIDITERRKFQQQLEAEREQAIQAKIYAEGMNRLKSNFLANLSHEIRTPLTGILGFAHLLNEQLTDEEMRVYSSHISSAGSRLLDTLNSLIDLSTVESGKLDVNLISTDVATETQRIIETLRPLAEAKLLRIDFALPAEEISALVDPHYFGETVRHVVNNAIKFTEAGSIGVSIGVDPSDRTAIVTVTDSGVGISEEFLPRICEPFQQESDGFARKFEGNGLGLTLTRHFLQAMNASMQVESQPGKGTTIRLRYPLAEAAVKKTGLLARFGIGSGKQ